MPFDLFRLLQAIWIAASLGLMLAFWRGLPLPATRRGVTLAAIAWIAALTAPFWIAGSHSFAVMASELDHAIPAFVISADQPAGTRFIHSFAGGTDAFAFSVAAGSYFSLERWMVGTLPLWIAFVIHKAMIAALMFWGSYLIARRMAGSDRSMAFAVGALGTISNIFTTTISIVNGVGFAALPIFLYLVVGRAGRRWYFPGIVAFAAIHAVSSTITHSAVALGGSALACAAFLGWRPTVRVCLALAFVGFCSLLNWHEGLYGYIQLGPLSSRLAFHSFGGDEEQARSLMSWVAWRWWGYFTVGQSVAALSAVLALAHMALTRSPLFLRALVVVVVYISAPAVLYWVPWADTGIPVLASLQAFGFNYLGAQPHTLSAILLAFAAGRQWSPPAPLRRLAFPGALAALVIALSFGRLTSLLIYEGLEWLSEGGQTMALPDPVATDRSWLPSDPTRVVSFNYRLPESYAAMRGLDSLDGNYNFTWRNLGAYWRRGINRDANVEGRLATQNIEKCCRSYDLDKIADLRLLRIANVGFVFSKLPLTGEGVVQVRGPEKPVAIPRADTPGRQRLKQYFDLLIHPAPTYVYSIGRPLPRVFPVSRVLTLPEASGDAEMIDAVREHGLDGAAVLQGGEAPRLPAAPLRVVTSSPVANGFDLEVDAPQGGLVGINVPYAPYWTATADGAPVGLRSANLIHMVVEVPAGAKQIRLRYHRPLLRDKLSAH